MIQRMKPFAKTASACLAAMLVATPVVADSPAFESPSGNITCFLASWHEEGTQPPSEDEQPLVCLIFEAQWNPPLLNGDPASVPGGGDPDCPLDSTRLVMLDPSGPAREMWECHGDLFWPISDALAYGSQWSSSTHSCDMKTSGVTCQNSQGNGFFLSRGTRTLN